MKDWLDTMSTYSIVDLRKTLRRLYLLLAVLFAVLFFDSLWPQHPHRNFFGGAINAFAVLVNFVSWFAVRRRLHIVVEEDTIESVTYRGRTITYPRDGVHKAGPGAQEGEE